MNAFTPRIRRIVGISVVLGGGVAGALMPRLAFAGCGGMVPDVGACIDSGIYGFWRGPLLSLWQGNQILLLAAHMIDQLRWFLVDKVFLTLYTALVHLFTPLFAPVATIALTIALLAIILSPVFGRTVVGNVRQILVLCIAIPAGFALVGPWIVDLEHIRTDIAGAIFTDLRNGAPAELVNVFKVSASATDMAAPTELDFTACGSDNYVPRTGIGLQDVAAATLWADWVSIACPQNAGTEQPQFPATWKEPAPTGPGYIYNGDLGDATDPHIRSVAIERIQQGVARAAWAVIPSFIAVVEAVIQLIFSLCFMVLAVAFPVTLLFSFFQQTFGGLSRLASAGAQVFKASFTVSALLSLMSVCLTTAAAAGNALGYIGFASAAMFIIVWLGIAALLTLKDCLLATAGSVEAATGVATAAPIQAMATGALVGGASLLTGGLAGAYAAKATLNAGGSAGQALGMGMSTSRPLAQMGTLASAMGMLPASVQDGLHMGEVHGRGQGMTMRALYTMRRDQQRSTTTIPNGTSPKQPGTSPASTGAGETSALPFVFSARNGYWNGLSDDALQSAPTSDPLTAPMRAVRGIRPNQTSSPFRRELAFKNKGAALETIYQAGAEQLRERATGERKAGHPEEATALDQQAVRLQEKAKTAGAIAKDGSAGIPERPSNWTPKQRTERRAVYQAALLEATGQADADRDQYDIRLKTTNDRLAAIPSEMTTIREQAEEQVLEALVAGQPEAAGALRRDADTKIDQLSAEHAMLTTQRDVDQVARTKITPTNGERIAPAVRAQATKLAKGRLAAMGISPGTADKQRQDTPQAEQQPTAAPQPMQSRPAPSDSIVPAATMTPNDAMVPATTELIVPVTYPQSGTWVPIYPVVPSLAASPHARHALPEPASDDQSTTHSLTDETDGPNTLPDAGDTPASEAN